MLPRDPYTTIPGRGADDELLEIVFIESKAIRQEFEISGLLSATDSDNMPNFNDILQVRFCESSVPIIHRRDVAS